MTDSSKPQQETEIPFLSHLVELRDRLLRSVLFVLVIFAGLFYFANDIYQFIATPLMASLPEGSSMIATKTAAPFLTPFKLALITSIFIGMPFLLYQAWSFIAPGLYKHEKRLAFPLLFSSIVLFYAGMAFAYFVVFPLIFGFLTTVAPEGVTVMTDISDYLDFVLKLFFAFGVAFEVPIATIIFVVIGWTTPEKLVEKRAYIIVAAFVVGMLLTPPDIVSQIMLAIPMWLLFEAGVLFSRMILKMRKQREEELEAEEQAENQAQTSAATQTATEETEMTDEEMDDEFEKAIAEEDALNEPDNKDLPKT